jgi:hypothetical protein
MSSVSERLWALKKVGRGVLARIPTTLPDISVQFLDVAKPFLISARQTDPGFEFQLFLDPQETARRYENLALLMEYEQLDLDISESKETAVSEEAVRVLKKRQAEVAKKILDHAGFARITPDSDLSLHLLMHENEKVHKCASIDDLVSKRIGHQKLGKPNPADENFRFNDDAIKETDKAAYALLLDLPDEQKVLANIYTYFTHAADEFGRLKHRALPGLVDPIKDSLPREMKVDECNTAVFYSISAAIMGGGARLIQWVYQELSGQYILTTLSPIRDFTKGKNRDEWLVQPKEDIQHDVLKYLLSNKDPVMKFHLANGAYIGDININPDSERDWITINYVYPVDENRLQKNARLYKNKNIIHMSAYVHDMVDEDDLSRAQCFADGDNIPILPKKPMTSAPTPA